MANIVALGAFAARSRFIDFDIVRKAVETEFSKKAKLIPINLKALERGAEVAAGGKVA